MIEANYITMYLQDRFIYSLNGYIYFQSHSGLLSFLHQSVELNSFIEIYNLKFKYLKKTQKMSYFFHKKKTLND